MKLGDYITQRYSQPSITVERMISDTLKNKVNNTIKKIESSVLRSQPLIRDKSG
jgi:hypothetical protein